MSRGRLFRAAAGLGIFAAVLLAYLPVWRAGFIWNDRDYVTAPALTSWRGLGRIWFEVGATQQYYPLLHSAFWFEHRLWGGAPLGYHLVNVLLHATSACLLALILENLIEGRARPTGALDQTSAAGRRALPWPWFAGLLFALHPVCVESVAWVTEQKNTLSTVFYLAAALVYIRHAESADSEGGRRPPGDGNPAGGAARRRPEVDGHLGRRRSWPWYFLAAGLYAAAILSKSVAATLPGALLVVIWWKRGRLEWKRDIAPLLPWFVLGAAIGIFTGYVEKRYVGAEGPAFGLTGVDRLLVAGRVIWFYLGKSIWPARLIFIYPRWPVEGGAWAQYLPPAGLLLGLFWLWRKRRRQPGLLAGALLFIGSLFPLLGLFNVYAFIFSYVADHWQYLAILPIAALGAWGWGRLAPSGLSGGLRLGLAAAVPLGLGVLTSREARHYRDPETFYRSLLARNPDCWMAHNNLGNILLAAGDSAGAKGEYEEALRLRPEYPEALADYGVVLAGEGRAAEAVGDYEKALRLGPDEPRIRNDLGIALAHLGRTDEAIGQYRHGLQLDSSYAGLHYNLALALERVGWAADARAEYGSTVRLSPDNAPARLRLGSLLRVEGQIQAAIDQDEAAVRLEPRWADARNDLGNALRAAGRLGEATSAYAEAVRLNPNDPDAHNNLGAALATAGRLGDAIAHFQRAVDLAPGFYSAQLNLAKSLQASGRGTEAQVHFEAAARLKPTER